MQARWVSTIALALLIAPALLIAGCSGGATPTPTVGPGYLAAATAFDGAYVQWRAAITGKTTPGEFAGPAATYAAALSDFDDAISSLGARASSGWRSQKAATSTRAKVSVAVTEPYLYLL